MLILLSLSLVFSTVFAPAQTAPPKPFDKAAQIGVADTGFEKPLCLMIENPNLPPGGTIHLVDPSPPRRVVAAVVEKKLTASCSSDQDNSPETSFYQLRAADGTPISSGALFIALYGTARPAVPKKKGGLISVDLEGDGRREYFRSCTSSEGVHLTIWSGPAPATGKRLWRRYHYLGYDTVPSCTERETALPY